MSNTIEKKGLPNEFTAGEVGDIYIDTDTGYRFKCTSKISIKDDKDTDVKYIWMPVRENYKQMVDDASTALSEKLQTEVDKNNLVDEIGNLDAGAIVQGIVKSKGVILKDIVNTGSSISDYNYTNNIAINAIDYVNATSVGNGAMANCLSLKSNNMPVVTSVGNKAMQNCVSLMSVNMPAVTSVGSNAMLNCLSLTSVNMSAATNVSGYAMQNCVSLMSVNMPAVTSVGNSAMLNCVSLTSINMSAATNVSERAMQNCISLTSVNMPVVTNIGSYAMANCLSLKSVRLGANQVATLANTNAFTGTLIAKGKGYIYVPDELVDSYKTATNWSVYADQIRPMSEYVEEVNE